ncbi:unnamed protein product [Meloidogyne enterolobii]|uniref:Uncharacterized protein n=1 Tax=Meloidogyne enterolobii TaxID=390850 RepID=A0ACB0XZZ5_MELEN
MDKSNIRSNKFDYIFPTCSTLNSIFLPFLQSRDEFKVRFKFTSILKQSPL